MIDGRIAYTGSQNLIAADFKKRFVYEELMARVTGPVVLQLQFVFVSDWFLETGEVIKDAAIFPDPANTGAMIAQVLPSGPDDHTENNLSLIIALFYSAKPHCHHHPVLHPGRTAATGTRRGGVTGR